MRVRRIKRAASTVFAAVVLLLGGACFYSLYEVRLAESEFPPSGRFVTVEGLRLHYRCEGSGRPVVLLHGNAGFLQDYDEQLADVPSGYRFCSFDRPGHGYSERPTGEPVTPAVQARLLHGALGQLGIQRPLLVGHSWSGTLVLRYALDYPGEVSGLVLLGAVAYGEEGISSPLDAVATAPMVGTLVRHTIWIPFSGGFVERSLARAFSPNPVPDEYLRAARMLWTRPVQARATAEDNQTAGPALREMSGRYGSIDLPVTIVTADSDLLVRPEKHAYPLHEAIAGSRLVVLSEAGHDVQHTRAGAVLDAIQTTSDRAEKTPPR